MSRRALIVTLRPCRAATRHLRRLVVIHPFNFPGGAEIRSRDIPVPSFSFRGLATAGGTIAGNARKALETQSGHKISTPENFQALTEAKKRIAQKKS